MNYTWDNDGLKITRSIPLGSAYPASTLSGKTLTGFLGNINGGVVSNSVAATSVTYTEAIDPADGVLKGYVTALWTPAAVTYGKKRAQIIVTIPGDKPYTIFDDEIMVLASLG